MDTLFPPKRRLAVAGALLGLATLALVAAASGPKLASQLALGVGAIAAGVVLATRRPTKRPFTLAERLSVVQRVGLSPRTGAALLEVDGQRFLVVHGDGFATVHPTQSPTLVSPRAGSTP